jgi:FKBP-type peptidyl-prolyl cis-trans isomerase 2
MIMKRAVLYFSLFLMVCMGAAWAHAADDVVIKNGSKVAFDYTLTVDGKVADTSAGKKPLEYVQGDGKLIPALTKKLEGMRAGEEKTIVLPPEEAYGKVNPDAKREVPKTALPQNTELKPGMTMQARDAKGNVFMTKIAEVKKDSVIMDMNHPLAGKTLTFKIKIVSIQ